MTAITAIPSSTLNRFQRLTDEWKRKSRYMSNTAQMAILTPYHRIIGMGMDAVPLILGELQRDPDHWFWALEAITEEDPVPAAAKGKVDQMAQADPERDGHRRAGR